MNQATNNILLIRPANFGYNEQTAASNHFQTEVHFDQTTVREEFDRFADQLKRRGVNVFVFDDTAEPPKPDAIFPNNWFTLHHDGTVILYPLAAANRRPEKRPDIIEKLSENFKINRVIDLSAHETQNRFLEGTGSIVFDHQNRVAYCCLSPRADRDLFIQVAALLAYEPVYFHARDQNGKAIYHTNVMMTVADKFAVICLESITDEPERTRVTDSLSAAHQIIEITHAQMNRFAGNMLAVRANLDEIILTMSQTAFDSLTAEQISALENYAELFPLPIPTIETTGGGSARCMIAEIFLEPLDPV